MTFWMLVGLMVVAALAFVFMPILKSGLKRERWFSLGLAVLLPIMAISGYLKIGHPQSIAQLAAQQSRAGSDAGNVDLSKLADILAEKLKAHPENAAGWALLARTYAEVHRYSDALAAYEKAVLLTPADPDLLTDYAETIYLNNGEQFDKRSEALVDQALDVEHAHQKGLMMKAAIAYNRQDLPTAIRNWELLLKNPSLDGELRKVITARVENTRHRVSPMK